MFRLASPKNLAGRLQVFINAGMLEKLPTPLQLRQGEIEMAPYVISTDVTAEEGYLRSSLGHPIVRQPFIFAHIGFDNFRLGSGLGSQLRSVCRHLELTYHRGMPVFDMQIVQTHPGGLTVLQESIEELLQNQSKRAHRQNWVSSRMLKDPETYYRKFLGKHGWIARAKRFEYPSPEEEGSNCPIEFFSLVGLMHYSATNFPETLENISPIHLPAYFFSLISRRFREGGRMGWFDGTVDHR